MTGFAICRPDNVSHGSVGSIYYSDTKRSDSDTNISQKTSYNPAALRQAYGAAVRDPRGHAAARVRPRERVRSGAGPPRKKGIRQRTHR